MHLIPLSAAPSTGAAINDEVARGDCNTCISNPANAEIGRCVYAAEQQAAANTGLFIPTGIMARCNDNPR